MMYLRKGFSISLIGILMANLVLPIYHVDAKITPKNPKKSKLITIKRGDTLWDLAGYYYNDSVLWPVFKKYNFFTDPDLIYPRERLAIGRKDAQNLVATLQKKISLLESEKKKKIQEIETLKTEIKQLNEFLSVQNIAEEKHVADLKNVLNSKEKEISVIKVEIDKIREENDMLKNTIFEIQLKLVENDATINNQSEEIEQLTTQNRIIANASYFLGFAVISTLLVRDTVR